MEPQEEKFKLFQSHLHESLCQIFIIKFWRKEKSNEQETKFCAIIWDMEVPKQFPGCSHNQKTVNGWSRCFIECGTSKRVKFLFKGNGHDRTAESAKAGRITHSVLRDTLKRCCRTEAISVLCCFICRQCKLALTQKMPPLVLKLWIESQKLKGKQWNWNNKFVTLSTH